MKKTGKLITLILVVAMALSLMSVAALADSSETYKDVVAGKWYVQYVDYVVENGLMSGMSEDTFAPNTAVNRAMFIQTLYALAEKPEVDVTDPFNDLAEGAYYKDAANWAKAKGVASGMGDNTFGPNKEITRQEAATFFQAYAEKIAGKDVSDSSGMNKYPDADKVAKWAKNAMGWAVKNGIISGSKDDGVVVLAPERGLTRAELAAMLKAFDKYLEQDAPAPVVPDKIGYGTVEVKVTATDKAVSGITFELSGNDNDENKISRKATTNDKGVAVFEDVPASNKDGYSVVAVNADARYGKQTPVTGVAVEPEKTTTVDYALKEQGGTVTIKLTANKEAAKARPILEGAVFYVIGNTYDNQLFRAPVETDKDGVASLKLPAGEYYLSSLYENPGDHAGNDAYDAYQDRYSAPTEELVAYGQEFKIENEDVELTATLQIPTVDYDVKIEVAQTNPEFFKEKGSLAGYQVRVTGVSKDGQKFDVTSNYTDKDGVAFVAVPESKEDVKYTFTLLNAPDYAKVTPGVEQKFAVTSENVEVKYELTHKTGTVEVKVTDKDTGKPMRAGTSVTVKGITAGGATFEAEAETSDNDGFVTLKNVPFSNEDGYTVDVDVEGEEYAVAAISDFVVDSEKETKDVDVAVTKKFGIVDVTLALKIQDGKDAKGNPTYKDFEFDEDNEFQFKLVGKTIFGNELTVVSDFVPGNKQTVSFEKVPYGTYKISAVGLDNAQELTIKVNNEVALDDSATTNNTVVVDGKNSTHVTVDVNGIMKSSPKVTVHYMYRGVDISGIATEIENLDTGDTLSAVSGDGGKDGAIFTYVPAGEYQLTINGKDSSDKVVYETDMYVYEIEQAQQTIFTVDNKEVNVVVNLSRKTK